MKNIKFAYLFLILLISACGGGGGSSPAYVASTPNGTSSLPFLQTTLASAQTPIKDPNAYVSSSTTTYNLTWGTPDSNGTIYANLFGNAITGSHLFPKETIMGLSVSGQCSSYPCSTGFTLAAPSQDVLSAWNQGWTGKGSNILMVDNYSLSDDYTHGITTLLIANRYAMGATMFGYDPTYSTSVQTYTGANLATPTNMNVVNLSFTYTPSSINCNSGCGTIPTTAAYNSAISSSASSNANLVSYLSGLNLLANTTLTNAVITKAAGNSAIPAPFDTTSLALSQNSSTVSRLLIVGALNTVGTTTAPASLASYSNTAGTNTTIQSRFLVESGTTPFGNGAIAVNGTAINFTGNDGTSYAAPRVAGYVAIVMQKFPNLGAIQTSSILLDTARYDTLTCNPNCDPVIYGKGEASLSRALAPVGYLR